MGEREQHEAGLSTAEVEELTRRGEVNHAPDDGMRSTWQIVRANLFTRINAIFAILVALVVATGSLRNALFGLAIVINSIVGIAQELRARHTLKQLSIVNTAEVTYGATARRRRSRRRTSSPATSSSCRPVRRSPSTVSSCAPITSTSTSHC